MSRTSQPMLRPSSMGVSRRVVLLLACVAVAPFLFGWLTQKTSDAPRPESRASDKLQVAASALDFGEQPPLEAFAWTLPLTNTTDRQLKVLDFELGCLCTKITPNTFTISPGETREVEVIVDLEPKDDDDLARPVREFAATIMPIFKGGWPRQDEWQLTGRIINPYIVEPAYVNFGDSLVRGMPFPSREVLISGLGPLRDLKVTCDPPLGDLFVERKNDAENVFAVRFTPHDSLPVGRHEFTIRMNGVDADGAKMAPTGVRVFAEVVSDVEVFPSVVHLGGLTLGQEGKSNVVLRSRTGQKFELMEIDQGSAGALQIQEHPTINGDRNYELRCQADQLGVRVFRVNFKVKSEVDGEPQEIALVVCYSGIEKLVADQRKGPPSITDSEAG